MDDSELTSRPATSTDVTAKVTGPASSTDNAITRFDGTTGKLVQNSTGILDDSGNLGLNGLTPTHSLTIPATGTGIAHYNVAAQDRLIGSWSGNVYTLKTEANGGTVRPLVVGSGSVGVTYSGNQGMLTTASGIGGGSGASGVGHSYTNGGASFTASSSTQVGMQWSATVNQTSTASFDALLLNATGFTAGSGGGKFIRCQVSGSDRWYVDSVGSVQACAGTAVPAGGTAGVGLKVSTTSNLGIFFGSGAPSLSAAQGSLYIRTDGSSSSTRLYVNSTGSTTWVAFTSAS